MQQGDTARASHAGAGADSVIDLRGHGRLAVAGGSGTGVDHVGDLSEDEIRPRRFQLIGDDRHREARFLAMVLLITLNGLDLLTTQAFLDRGVNEGNPLAEFLIGRGSVGAVKLAILIGLCLAMYRARPKLSTTCAMYAVAGFYTCAVTVNLLALASIR